MKMASFGPWDYTILAIVLATSAGIGIYYRFSGGKQKTAQEYLLADRSMPVLPVAFSLMASFMSAVTLLGVSMENYQFGTMFLIINLAYVITTPVAAYLILPVFYRLKTASVYEYLELRFGYATRLIASLAFTVQMTLYMGIVLYAPALALQAVTGLNQVLSILVIGIVCTFYSTLGGLKAVLITDVFQSLLMFAAIFCVIIGAAVKAGGLAPIWRVAEAGGRIEFLNISVDPTTRHTWWTQIIGGAATYLSIYGVNQTQIQRLLSCRNLKSSQASLFWNLPILMLLSLSTCFSGLCLYYYYRECDPLLEGRILSRDQLLPLFVVDTMSHLPGISGLFVSGIFSGSLSTISSAISSLAAVTLEDYIKPLSNFIYKKPLNEGRLALYSKLLSLIFGAICIGVAFMAGSMGGVLQASLSIFGIVGGPLLGLFTLGMYITFANQKGAIAGVLTSLAFSFWIGFGKPRPAPKTLPFSTEGCPSPTVKTYIGELFTTLQRAETPEETHYFYLYRISYMWYAVLGFLITFLLGIACSWLFEKLHWDSNARIYTDAEHTIIKYDLFVPPVANSLRRRQMPVVVVTNTNNENGIHASSTAVTSLENMFDQKQSAVAAINSTTLNESVNSSTTEITEIRK